MLTYFVNLSHHWESKLWRRPAFQSLVTALQQAMPVIAVDIYLRLAIKLILAPNALIVKLFKINPAPFKTFFAYMVTFLSLADVAAVLIFVAALTYQYLTHLGHRDTSLPLLTNCLAVFLFFGDKTQAPIFSMTQYFVITLITLFSSYAYHQYCAHYHASNPYSLPYLIWSGMIIIISLFLHQIFRQHVFEFFLSDIWTQKFFATAFGLLIMTTVAPLLYLLGVTLPPELAAPSPNMYGVSSNLHAFLSTGQSALPTPENVYTTYGAFTLFGGVGNTLAICLLLLFSASKQQRHIARISWLPSLFDSSYILFVGLPLFFNPLFIIPMILVNLMSLVLSYLAIWTHFIQPIVFVAPDGLPNILLPSIASPTPIRATIVTVVIFALSVLIYRPFLSHITLEVPHEK